MQGDEVYAVRKRDCLSSSISRCVLVDSTVCSQLEVAVVILQEMT